jgi:hypothetical protein
VFGKEEEREGVEVVRTCRKAVVARISAEVFVCACVWAWGGKLRGERLTNTLSFRGFNTLRWTNEPFAGHPLLCNDLSRNNIKMPIIFFLTGPD